ncbi:DUF305 domain-containing protein [Micromonospora cremea]|uniref:DUF305 domain-containing protein n=1 Tax=Micromonospora cremea TaxID=709881 RepID=UPI0011811144
MVFGQALVAGVDQHPLRAAAPGSATDIQFLRLMIPHHTMAVKESKAALPGTVHDRLTDLELAVVRSQTARNPAHANLAARPVRLTTRQSAAPAASHGRRAPPPPHVPAIPTVQHWQALTPAGPDRGDPRHTRPARPLATAKTLRPDVPVAYASMIRALADEQIHGRQRIERVTPARWRAAEPGDGARCGISYEHSDRTAC